MHDSANGLRRMSIRRSWVNRGKKEGPGRSSPGLSQTLLRSNSYKSKQGGGKTKCSRRIRQRESEGPAAKAGATVIPSITTIRATTAINTMMRFMSITLSPRARLLGPAALFNAITLASGDESRMNYWRSSQNPNSTHSGE